MMFLDSCMMFVWGKQQVLLIFRMGGKPAVELHHTAVVRLFKSNRGDQTRLKLQ